MCYYDFRPDQCQACGALLCVECGGCVYANNEFGGCTCPEESEEEV